MRKQRIYLLMIVCTVVSIVLGLNTGAIQANQAASDYYRIVVLSDIHLPYKPALKDTPLRQDQVIAAKKNLREQVNSWDDVDLVVALGDVTGGFGTTAEYAYAQEYFSHLRQPYTAVTGNHDFMYSEVWNLSLSNAVRTILDVDDYVYADTRALGLHWPWAKTDVRQQKLDRFKRLFSLESLYYSKRAGPCLLIFLSPDMVSDNKYQMQFSSRQLDWFRAELAANPNVPTIVFSHAPLKGTLSSSVDRANTAQNIAQPYKILQDIIRNNPQLFIWVSGHLHLPPTNENFSSPLNVFENRVTNIHNTDLDRQHQWTNSIFIYSDHVVVRTFDHDQKEWIAKLERTIPFPASP